MGVPGLNDAGAGGGAGLGGAGLDGAGVGGAGRSDAGRNDAGVNDAGLNAAGPNDAKAQAEHVARASYGRLLALLAAPTGDIPTAEDALADAFVQALATWPDAGVPANPEAWLLTVARNRIRDLYRSAAHRTSVPLDVFEGGAEGGAAGVARAAAADGSSPGLDDSSASRLGLGAGAGGLRVGFGPGFSGPAPDEFAAPLGGRSIDARVSSAGYDLLDELDFDSIPDKRLALLFVCAHPAIEAGIRTPLMLQTVLGFESQQIAQAFALPAPAMAQRLVRAKRRIRDARIPFVVPSRADMPGRIPPVLEAIYGAYAIDWQVVSGATLRESLSVEALYLAETLATLLPDEPEALGLAALICLSLSRVSARAAAGGEFVPLDRQDPSLWDAALIARGEGYLRRAHALGRIGRFQLEAAIQSVHCARAASGETDWVALRRFHEALVRVAPTLGAHVSLAATLGATDGPDAGLAYLAALDGSGAAAAAGAGGVGAAGGAGAAGASAAGSAADELAFAAARRFQPLWATRAHLLAESGQPAAAALAFERAISLTTDSAARAYLQRRRADIAGDNPVP